jgi:hypothetical protein
MMTLRRLMSNCLFVCFRSSWNAVDLYVLISISILYSIMRVTSNKFKLQEWKEFDRLKNVDHESVFFIFRSYTLSVWWMEFVLLSNRRSINEMKWREEKMDFLLMNYCLKLKQRRAPKIEMHCIGKWTIVFTNHAHAFSPPFTFLPTLFGVHMSHVIVSIARDWSATWKEARSMLSLSQTLL